MPDAAVGLCFDCQHCRVVPGGRSTFYLCERSFTEARFPKYPVLPVLACPGYQPPDADRADPAGSRRDDKLTG